MSLGEIGLHRWSYCWLRHDISFLRFTPVFSSIVLTQNLALVLSITLSCNAGCKTSIKRKLVISRLLPTLIVNLLNSVKLER